jgi:PAS domain S-box-containing protein
VQYYENRDLIFMRIPLKLRLFLPITIIITAIILFVTVWFVKKSTKSLHTQVESNLVLEVETIAYMFEREYLMKLQKVQHSMNISHAILMSQDFRMEGERKTIEVENQETGQLNEVDIELWHLNGSSLLSNHEFVDSISSLLDVTMTIFQKTPIGYVRLSTNVNTSEGSRAISTYIPNHSPVVQAIEAGNSYQGRAFVVNSWYITTYQPLIVDEEIIGMFYVGDKEKNLNELKQILYSLRIGVSGYPFVFNNEGSLVIHPHREGEFWGDSLLFKKIEGQKRGVIDYEHMGRTKTMAFQYFDKFQLYIAAAVYKQDETKELMRDAVIGSVIAAIIALILILVFLYYFSTERLYKYLIELEQSQESLDSVRKALDESEERFKKLFDSTGDDIFVTNNDEDIIEVNQAACETLGYTRIELLQMKITEIKSLKYKDTVTENRRIIFEKGFHVFDSEHVAKDGSVINVEFTSRLVRYDEEDLILSVVRNITRRVESERQILSAIIRGEERERQRFAREMHDGLGPLLSTIKLYVNELNSASSSMEERQELIHQCNELIDDAVLATRTISNNLMPTVIHSYGLVKAVQAFCEKVNKTKQLNIEFETENIQNRFDVNLELIFFRIISELINNTIKHAQANNIRVLLVKHEKYLKLYFNDDGRGFVLDEILHAENMGMGLKNIVSRVKSINGNYQMNSSPGNGFTIQIEIQL